MVKHFIIAFVVFSYFFVGVPVFANNTPIPGPHEFLDPDSSTGVTDKPVKVYILSGQSNMVGFGQISPLGTAGTLETITKTDGLFPHLIDGSGNWTVRQDVMYRGVVTAIGNGYLTPGVMGGDIGPEMGFGQVMGYYHDEPVIVLKSSQGNRSISWDFAPPSTERFDYNGRTYAGYGDSPNDWQIGTTPSPIEWYAGRQYDECFLDEADWSPMAATLGFDSITNVTDVLDNFATEYPDYAAQGFEIAGFAWWQGHKDQGEPHASRYEQNMVNFIKDIRQYYENRYPANISTHAPFVLATIAFDGWDLSGDGLTVAEGQLAVSDAAKHPEFEGIVKTIEARGFWRDSSISPEIEGYHYNRNAETYMLAGDALARGLLEMEAAYDVRVGRDMVTWNGRSVDIQASVEASVSVQSYYWEAFADDGVTVQISNDSIADPSITITKPTGEMTSVLVRVTVNDGVAPPVYDSMYIDVYDTACKASRLGLGISNKLDLSGNCIIDLADLTEALAGWLIDGTLSGPVEKY